MRVWHLQYVFVCILILAGCEQKGYHRPEQGFFIESQVDPRGNEALFTSFLPYHQTTPQKMPLIVFLNGRGQNGSDGLSMRSNFGPQMWEVRHSFFTAAIAPQCSEGGTWATDSDDCKRCLAFIEHAIENYNVDTDRIYLTGVSSGGDGAWVIGSDYAQKFAAIVPLCGSGGDVHGFAVENLQIWNFCNDQDRKDLVGANRESQSSMMQSGVSPLYTEYHASGHDCWNRAYRSKAMLEWLLEQSKSKNKLESEKFRLINNEVDQQNEALARERDELVIQGGSGFESITCGEFYRLIDFHFHSKFVPGQSLALHLQSTNSDDQFVLHLPYAVDGPASFTKNSGNVFAYISPRAQNQLDPKGWNDIRLRVEKDRLSVLINGFNALDQPLDLSEIKGWNISLEPSGPKDTEMRFRYLRWRPLTWLMSSNN